MKRDTPTGQRNDARPARKYRSRFTGEMMTHVDLSGLPDKLTPAELRTLERYGEFTDDSILAKLTEGEILEIEEWGYKRPAKKKQPTEPSTTANRKEVNEAIRNIYTELQNVDRARESLVDAYLGLRNILKSGPRVASCCYDEFWQAGGCTAGQFREWMKKQSYAQPCNPVPGRKHLRLVVAKQPRRQQVPRYRPRQNFVDDGPEAA